MRNWTGHKAPPFGKRVLWPKEVGFASSPTGLGLEAASEHVKGFALPCVVFWRRSQSANCQVFAWQPTERTFVKVMDGGGYRGGQRPGTNVPV